MTTGARGGLVGVSEGGLSDQSDAGEGGLVLSRFSDTAGHMICCCLQ